MWQPMFAARPFSWKKHSLLMSHQFVRSLTLFEVKQSVMVIAFSVFSLLCRAVHSKDKRVLSTRCIKSMMRVELESTPVLFRQDQYKIERGATGHLGSEAAKFSSWQLSIENEVLAATNALPADTESKQGLCTWGMSWSTRALVLYMKARQRRFQHSQTVIAVPNLNCKAKRI